MLTLAVGYDDAGTVVCRADLKILSTFNAHSKSGKRLGYLVGSANASAAFSLIVFKSFFHSSKTDDIILEKGRWRKGNEERKYESKRGV